MEHVPLDREQIFLEEGKKSACLGGLSTEGKKAITILLTFLREKAGRSERTT